MISEKHFNPAIYSRLSQLCAGAPPYSELYAYLSSLSNAQFRTAGYLLGERVLLEMGNDEFWQLACGLVAYNTKAFLVTVLKSFAARRDAGQCDFKDAGLRRFCAGISANDIDCRKTLRFLLPLCADADEVQHLFLSLGMKDQSEWIPFLLHCSTLPSFYVLFLSLRHMEHNTDYVRKVTLFLIKQGDSLSFNLASLLKAYFGLEDVRSTFSLNVKPYELSRLELSYDAFFQAMSF